MCKNLPAHQGSFLPSCQMDKKKETKTLKHQATLKASGAITLVRVTSHSAEKSPTPCFHLLWIAVPSLPSLHLCIHCSKVSPPCNLIHFTKYLPSLLYFKVSELLTPTFFNWTGLPKLREKLPIQRTNLFCCFHSHSDNKIYPKYRSKHI